jgi:hypothetical protein
MKFKNMMKTLAIALLIGGAGDQRRTAVTGDAECLSAAKLCHSRRRRQALAEAVRART